jgi:uncharacterized protein with GYD domain
MPKYLFVASYRPEGAKGVIDKGGTARREAITELASGLGGSVESFYFSWGEGDVYTVIDLPDDAAAAAVSMTVNADGRTGLKTLPLIEPETIDEAATRTAQYRPPGG